MTRLLTLLPLMLLAFALPAQGAPIDDAKAAMSGGDYRKAYVMLRPLARDGHMEAQFELGNLYSLGLGVQQDAEKSVQWLSKAAEQGHFEAANTLGKMYVSGMGVARNEKEGKRWFNRAAEIAAAQDREDDCY